MEAVEASAGGNLQRRRCRSLSYGTGRNLDLLRRVAPRTNRGDRIFKIRAKFMITPPNARNLAVAFSVPVGYIIGGGAIPTFIGAMGDGGSFATGFVVTGLLIGSGGLLSFRLRLPAPVDAKKMAERLS